MWSAFEAAMLTAQPFTALSRLCPSLPASPAHTPAGSICFPSPEELVRDCGKMALLERLLNRLLPEGHKVLIFSQVSAVKKMRGRYRVGRCAVQRGHG